MAKQHDSQTEKFLACVAQSMPRLSGDEMQRFIDSSAKYKKKALARVFCGLQAAEVKKGLLLNVTHVLPATKPYDLNAFYGHMNRYCRAEHISYLLSNRVEVVSAAPAQKLASYDLVKPALGSQMRSELPDGYAFRVSEGLARLASLLEEHRGGRLGRLLANGRFNIMYLDVDSKVVLVKVYYSSRHKRWDITVLNLDEDYDWDAGLRVFSRIAVA